MKFLLITAEFPPGPGGLGTHAHQVVTHLVQAGWQGLVAASQGLTSEAEIDEFNRQQPFPVHRLPRVGRGPGLLVRWRIVSNLIQTFDPDILIGSGDGVNYFTALTARWHGLPWIAVEHGRTPHGPELQLKRWAYRHATAVVCVSEYTRGQLQAARIWPRRTEVIPNGGDAARFRVLPECELKAIKAPVPAGSQALLLTVGSVTDRKGQAVVVRAMPQILQRAPRTHYLCAGLPHKGADLTALARELGVQDYVHVLGRVEPAPLLALMNRCDLFVMTSRHTGEEWEGYGIAVVEAALCGKPAVVSTPSGLAEAIEEGRTGLGVRQDDPSGTAAAILSLLEDRDRLNRMGEAARNRALGEQTWEQRVRQYDRLMRDLLPNGAAVPQECLS